MLLTFGFAPSVLVKAQVVDQAMGQIGAAAKTADIEAPVAPQRIIMEVIRRILTLTGILFMGLIVYGGYLFVTAHGEEEQITKGKKIIIASIVGIVIVLMSYSITLFIGTRVGPMVTEGGVVER